MKKKGVAFTLEIEPKLRSKKSQGHDAFGMNLRARLFVLRCNKRALQKRQKLEKNAY